MHHYAFSKNFKRVLQAQKQCSKFPNFGLSTKKVIETQKCTQDAWFPLVLSIFLTYHACQLWGVITFEQVISLCRNFQDNLILYIPFIWKTFIKIWDWSRLALVHVTWNDPFSDQWARNILNKIMWTEKKMVRGIATTSKVPVAPGLLKEEKFTFQRKI